MFIDFNETSPIIEDEISDGQCYLNFHRWSVFDNDKTRDLIEDAVCNADEYGLYGMDRVEYVQKYMETNYGGYCNAVEMVPGRSFWAFHYYSYFAIFNHNGKLWIVYRFG